MRLCRMVSTLVLGILMTMSLLPPAHAAAESVSLAYFLKDTTNQMTIADVSSPNTKQLFTPCDGTLRAGYSRSTYWLRIDPEFFTRVSDNEDHVYLIIINTLLKRATMYVPDADSPTGYASMDSGYGFPGETQDEGFICPAFRVPLGSLTGPVYLKLVTPNTMNSKIVAMGSHDFTAWRQRMVLFIGLLFGVFFTLLIYNLLAFMKLRNSFYLYFVFYILCIILYQGAYTGAFQLLYGQATALLQEHITVLGLFTTAGMVLFARSFMETKIKVKAYDAGLKALYVLHTICAVLHFAGYRQIANLMAIILANTTVLYLIVTAIVCIRKNLWQAKYFLTAWILVLMSLALLLLRGNGIFPNSLLSTLSLTLFAAVEFVLLSIAMAERVRLLQVDIAVNRQRLTQAEESTKAAELAFLHAQMKPHFLFNALNAIATLCVVSPGKARELILDLSTYLQHMFDFSSLPGKISLEDEMSFIKAYLRIQKARFGDKLSIQFDIDDIRGAWLPPLVIQPLVENAIRHGIRKEKTEGIVNIRAKLQPDGIRIEVEDDGVGIPQEKLALIRTATASQPTGVGIVNIDMRLKRIFGTGLEIASEEGCGTRVSFTIPR